MSYLDPRTIILLAGMMGALMAVVLYFLRRNFPPTIKGLTEWSAAAAIIFAATALIGTRGTIPLFFSVVVANLGLLCGLSLLYFGSQRFFGLPASVRIWGSLILVAAPLLAWYTHVEPHYGMRVIIMTLFMVLLSLTHARLRRPDRFGRFGGEEFVALLPETSPAEAAIVAERIRADLETVREIPCCTVSIGIAASRPDDNAVDALLARADAALYRAKAAGRNRVETVTLPTS